MFVQLLFYQWSLFLQLLENVISFADKMVLLVHQKISKYIDWFYQVYRLKLNQRLENIVLPQFVTLFTLWFLSNFVKIIRCYATVFLFNIFPQFLLTTIHNFPHLAEKNTYLIHFLLLLSLHLPLHKLLPPNLTIVLIYFLLPLQNSRNIRYPVIPLHLEIPNSCKWMPLVHAK